MSLLRRPAATVALGLALAATSALAGVTGAAAGVGGADRRAAGGTLDPSFGGGDGQVVTRVRDGAEGYVVAVQGRGTLVGGYTYSTAGMDWVLVRYRADGTVDQGFGQRGRFTLDFGGYEGVQDVRVLPDGRLLVAGGGHGVFAVVRLTADGRLDRGFGGGDGIVRTRFGPGYANAQAIVPVRHGRFVVAGGYERSSGDNAVALARYLPDGRLDPAFSRDGRRRWDAFPNEDDSSRVAAALRVGDGNGVTVVGSTSRPATTTTGTDILLARFTGRGGLDRSFGGGDGWVVQDLVEHEDVQSAVRLRGGALLVGGMLQVGSDRMPLVVRFLAEGSLDTGWSGGDGFATPSTGHTQQSWHGMARAPGRKTVLVGQVDGQDAAVLRLIWSGAPDGEFGGGDGVLETPFGSDSGLRAVVVRDDGRVVAAGYGSRGTGTGLAVERLLAG